MIELFLTCMMNYAEVIKNVVPKIRFEDDKTLVMAHRGLTSAHLENTLSALLSAFEAGADGVEFDVQLSGDLVPMVFHDRNLDRLTGVFRNIDDVSYDELKTIQQVSSRYRESYPISTLHEVLMNMPAGKLINIELKETTMMKGEAGMRRVLDVISPFKGTLTMIISSFEPQILAMVSAMDQDLPLGLLVDRRGDINAVFAEAAETLPRIDAIHPHIALVNETTSQIIKDLGVNVIFWGHKRIGEEAFVTGPKHVAIITDVAEKMLEK